MTKKRTAITGLGVVSSLGNSPESLHSALCGQKSNFGRVDEYQAEGLVPRAGGRITSFKPEQYLQGRLLRPLDRTGRLVAAAAKLALESSGWTSESLITHEVGLVVGTMFSSMHTIIQFDRHSLTAGPSYASPMDFANTVINSPAGQSAIWHKLRGINSTIAGGTSSGLMALGYAADLIAYRNQTAILAGGADEFCFEAFLGCEHAGLLHELPDKEECTVPFDIRRNGFAFTEASAFLMLEEWESALARGATILAEVRGHASAYNPHYLVNGHGASAITKAIRASLEDAGAHPSEIDCISASANGGIRGDRNEANALAEALSDAATKAPVTAIKSMLGETLGAGGALQAVDLVQTMHQGTLPGICGLLQVDPSLPALNFCREPLDMKVGCGLISSVGLDGHACSLLVHKV